MDWNRQCAAVIPCFNEAPNIATVIRDLQPMVADIMVVDDGSTDDTVSRAAAAGVEVVRLGANRGKGAALQVGWRRARARGFRWALTLDGDGQHAPADAPALFACAETTGAALVVGNRMGRPTKMPWLRRQVNRWMSRRLSSLTGVSLADSQCGFRLMRLDAATSVPIRTSRFEIESEQLVNLIAAGYQVEFVPIQVIYKANPSKIHPFADTWRWFKWWYACKRNLATVHRPVRAPILLRLATSRNATSSR